VVQAPESFFFVIYTTLCGGMTLRLPKLSKFKKRRRKHTPDYGTIHYIIIFVAVITAAYYVTRINILSTITEAMKRSSLVHSSAAATLNTVSACKLRMQCRDHMEF